MRLLARLGGCARPALTLQRGHVLPRRAFRSFPALPQNQNFGPAQQQPMPVYFSQPPPPPKRSRWRRLGDMAIGSALTITLYIGYLYWESMQIEQLESDLDILERELDGLRHEFSGRFRLAREANESEELREITFGFVGELSSRLKATEVGPLARLNGPLSIPGGENIPTWETKVFVGNKSVGSHDLIAVAVNLDTKQLEAPMPSSWSGSSPPLDQKSTVAYVEEVIYRVSGMAPDWVKSKNIGPNALILVAIRNYVWIIGPSIDGFDFVAMYDMAQTTPL